MNINDADYRYYDLVEYLSSEYITSFFCLRLPLFLSVIVIYTEIISMLLLINSMLFPSYTIHYFNIQIVCDLMQDNIFITFTINANI